MADGERSASDEPVGEAGRAKGCAGTEDGERAEGGAAVSEGKRFRVLDPERDPAAIKALTHPLRIRLLGLLRMNGPATASELAARTGESSASTSYHLRVLAKYAFVTEAEHRDGRERRWRPVHEVTTWDHAAMDASPVGRHFAGTMARRQIENLGVLLARYERDTAGGRLGREWLEHSGITDLLPRLTPESLGELQRTFEAKLDELTARDAGDAQAEQVMVLLAQFPIARGTGGEPGGEPRTEPVAGEGAAAAIRPGEESGPTAADGTAAGNDAAAGSGAVATGAAEAGRPAPRRVRGYTHD